MAQTKVLLDTKQHSRLAPRAPENVFFLQNSPSE